MLSGSRDGGGLRLPRPRRSFPSGSSPPSVVSRVPSAPSRRAPLRGRLRSTSTGSQRWTWPSRAHPGRSGGLWGRRSRRRRDSRSSGSGGAAGVLIGPSSSGLESRSDHQARWVERSENSESGESFFDVFEEIGQLVDLMILKWGPHRRWVGGSIAEALPYRRPRLQALWTRRRT